MKIISFESAKVCCIGFLKAEGILALNAFVLSHHKTSKNCVSVKVDFLLTSVLFFENHIKV
jgi:hypothetical protein